MRIGGRITLFIRIDLETDLLRSVQQHCWYSFLYPLLMPLTKLRGTLEEHFLEFALFLMIQADG
ncbi:MULTISPECIES: hypothetical protein [Bacillus]|uniref:hypothetical protein n=1 Tax=Bacillus TaxID=1386 RepID=UPI0020B3AC3C|nr:MULTISPECIES: hypothetical protein [Bacillus]